MKYHKKYIVLFLTAVTVFSCQSKQKKPANSSVENGKEVLLQLKPGDNNPRNSEGDFIKLKDGRLLFVYSHYTGDSGGDHDPAYLAGRYSSDGGNTWSDDHIIVENEGDMNVMSVSLLRLQSGDIALFYLRKNSTTDCIPMIRKSHDEGETWSKPTPVIKDKKGYFVLNNDRVIQLQDGRLLMAVARHAVPGGETKSQADLFSYYSDDNGKTWNSGSQVPNTTEIITQEPGVVELKDGRIMMYIRASGGFQQLSYSVDRGETWSHIEQSTIPSPVSPASIERIPSTGDLLMVWNNNGLNQNRTPFNSAISMDEGETWTKIRTIQDNPDGWYCYTAIHFTDSGEVLLGHCAGNRPQGTGLAVTDITKLELEWIYGDNLKQ